MREKHLREMATDKTTEGLAAGKRVAHPGSVSRAFQLSPALRGAGRSQLASSSWGPALRMTHTCSATQTAEGTPT